MEGSVNMDNLVFTGGALANNSWKIVLTINDEGINLCKKEGARTDLTNKFIPFSEVKQIVVNKGKIEIIGKFETIKIVIKADEAAKVADYIKAKMSEDIQISQHVQQAGEYAEAHSDVSISTDLKLKDNIKLYFINNDFAASKLLVSSNAIFNTQTIYLDEIHEKFAFVAGKNSTPKIYNYSDIINFELLKDGGSIAKGRAGSALVGGLLLGAAGAVIGSSRAKQQMQTCNSMIITITVDDPNSPLISIPLISSEIKTASFLYESIIKTAQSTMSMLGYMQNKGKPDNAPIDMAAGISSADEIKKYKQLFDDGVLTEDEFTAKKKQLLDI